MSPPAGPADRPQYFGGPRCGQFYRRPVAAGERLVVMAYDRAPDGRATSGHAYALRHRPDGRPVLACLGPVPDLPRSLAA